MPAAIGGIFSGQLETVLQRMAYTAKEDIHSTMRGVRHTTEEDLELLQKWILADPDHCGKTAASFFLPQKEDDGVLVQHLCFTDGSSPVLFARCSTIMRLDIQFDVQSRLRTARMLEPGLGWLVNSAKNAGFRQVIFESTHPPLIAFATNPRRLGFRKSPDELLIEVA